MRIPHRQPGRLAVLPSKCLPAMMIPLSKAFDKANVSKMSKNVAFLRKKFRITRKLFIVAERNATENATCRKPSEHRKEGFYYVNRNRGTAAGTPAAGEQNETGEIPHQFTGQTTCKQPSVLRPAVNCCRIHRNGTRNNLLHQRVTRKAAGRWKEHLLIITHL